MPAIVPIPVSICACLSRLNAESLQPYNLSLVFVYSDDIVLCPCAAEIYFEYLYRPRPSLLHCINDGFVLAFKALLLDLLNLVIAPYKRLEIICKLISRT